jgi:hypothetical protein
MTPLTTSTSSEAKGKTPTHAAGQARVQGLMPGVQTGVPFSPTCES